MYSVFTNCRSRSRICGSRCSYPLHSTTESGFHSMELPGQQRSHKTETCPYSKRHSAAAVAWYLHLHLAAMALCLLAFSSSADDCGDHPANCQHLRVRDVVFCRGRPASAAATAEAAAGGGAGGGAAAAASPGERVLVCLSIEHGKKTADLPAHAAESETRSTTSQ